MLSTHTTPHKYSGELFGIQYLYAQNGNELPEMVDEEVERDEGFSEELHEYPEGAETIDAVLSSDGDSEVGAEVHAYMCTGTCTGIWMCNYISYSLFSLMSLLTTKMTVLRRTAGGYPAGTKCSTWQNL